MSLLTSFVLKKVIEELESEFIAHEPQLQDAFIQEVAYVSEKIGAWVKGKLESKDGATK